MEWLKSIVKNNPIASLIIPISVSGMSFLTNLIASLSDGIIDPIELQHLLSTADGLQTLLLLIIMYAFKEKKGNKKHGK
jgi:hypothetical protein